MVNALFGISGKEREILKKILFHYLVWRERDQRKKIEVSKKEKIEVSRVVNSIIFLLFISHFPFSHFPLLSSNSKQSINFLKNPHIQSKRKRIDFTNAFISLFWFISQLWLDFSLNKMASLRDEFHV